MKIRLLFITILLSFLSGCNSPKPEEIIGKWIPASDSPKIIKNTSLPNPIYLSEQPFFIFNADGTFAVEKFPEVLVGLHDSNKIVSGKGRWIIDRYQRADVVKLKFTEGISIETQMWISKGVKSTTLYFWIEEPGVGRFDFVKKSEEKSYK